MDDCIEKSEETLETAIKNYQTYNSQEETPKVVSEQNETPQIENLVKPEVNQEIAPINSQQSIDGHENISSSALKNQSPIEDQDNALKAPLESTTVYNSKKIYQHMSQAEINLRENMKRISAEIQRIKDFLVEKSSTRTVFSLT